jgi:hypothetical protein
MALLDCILETLTHLPGELIKLEVERRDLDIGVYAHRQLSPRLQAMPGVRAPLAEVDAFHGHRMLPRRRGF